MTFLANQGNNLFSLPPGNELDGTQRMREIHKIRSDSIDSIVWAAAQQNALAKMELFTKMAKKINDQQ